MPDTTQDPVGAYLAEAGKRAADERTSIGLAPSDAPSSADDVPRLLAALETVLELADSAYVMLANHETGHREPVAWDLDPAAVREAISRELLGEGSGDG